VCVIFVGMLAHLSKCAMTEDELKDFLANVYEKMASDMCTRLNEAEWNYDTDINNEEKQQILVRTILVPFEKIKSKKHFSLT
jgi:hypothetical protein